MMTQCWEPFAEALANAPNFQSLLEEENISIRSKRSVDILLGRDTRPTGEALLQAANFDEKGIKSIVGAVEHDMGIVTTPQLHWMVWSKSMGFKASEADYYMQLSKSFRCLMDMVLIGKIIKGSMDLQLTVDGANGVGGVKLEQLKKYLIGLEIQVRNTCKQGESILNEGAGADYVQKEKVVPCGFDPNDVGLRASAEVLKLGFACRVAIKIA